MDQTLETLRRARVWVREDVRVRAALIHGSVVKDEVTPLSDLDLIVVAEPGERDAIWAEREQLTQRLFGAPMAVGEVLAPPYRWQARTADLDMLDLTIDEGAVRAWYGFEGPVEFLIDRADVRGEFERAMDELTRLPPPVHDAAAECDGTWGMFSKLIALFLHHRTLAVRIALNDLITHRLLPMLDRSAYSVGAVGDRLDGELITRLDQVYPSSCEPGELGRAIRAAADWYSELLTGWAVQTGRPRPASGLERGVIDAMDRQIGAWG